MKNYFALFALPIEFNIDLGELEKKYLEFQQQFHPDKSGVDEVEKSILINDAYKILADDFLRACYILSLKGIDIRHDERAIKVDLATLGEVLELQEKIAEITDKNEIEELRKELNLEIKSLLAEAAKYLVRDEINIAAQLLVKNKYLKKSLEDLKNHQRKLV